MKWRYWEIQWLNKVLWKNMRTQFAAKKHRNINPKNWLSCQKGMLKFT